MTDRIHPLPDGRLSVSREDLAQLYSIAVMQPVILEDDEEDVLLAVSEALKESPDEQANG